MITCIIIENDPKQSETLQRILSAHFTGIEVMAVCETVVDAVAQIQRHNPELLFLDVQLNGTETGFDVLRQTADSRYKVIFITSFEEYAIQAFRLSALDYLIKPIDRAMLAEAVSRLESQREEIELLLRNWKQREIADMQLLIPISRGKRLVRLGDIVIFEAESEKLKAYLQGGGIVVSHCTMNRMEKALGSLRFFRAHRRHLVNLAHVIEYKNVGEEAKLTLTGGLVAEVPKHRKARLLELLNDTDLLGGVMD